MYQLQLAVLIREDRVGSDFKSMNPFAVSSDGDKVSASSKSCYSTIVICFLIFGILESVGFYLIASLGFVYPLLSIVVIVAIFITQNALHRTRWKSHFGLLSLLFVVLVLQVGPALCLFSPLLERFYDFPFTLIRIMLGIDL
jgi:hypothetical protein